MTGTPLYVVYRVNANPAPHANWQNPELSPDSRGHTLPLHGTDVAQYPDKATAVDLCRRLRQRQEELSMLGVQFGAAYVFAVRGQEFKPGGGIRAWPVILNTEAEEPEYESEPQRGQELTNGGDDGGGIDTVK